MVQFLEAKYAGSPCRLDVRSYKKYSNCTAFNHCILYRSGVAMRRNTKRKLGEPGATEDYSATQAYAQHSSFLLKLWWSIFVIQQIHNFSKMHF